MARKILNEQERNWLKEHESVINQDYVPPTEWPMSQLSEQQLHGRTADTSWLELIELLHQDASMLDRFGVLDPVEREVLALRYCANLSERKIAARMETKILVDGIVLRSTQPALCVVQGIIRRGREKLRKKLFTALPDGVECGHE